MSVEKVKTGSNSKKRIKLMQSGLSKENILESPIQKLNADCLSCIFKKLSIVDLIQAKRVCRSWQKIAKWYWSGMKKLTLTPKQLGFRPVGTQHAYKKISEHVVEQILKLCGRYLQDIDASKMDSVDMSYLIGIYCKNIRSVKLLNASIEGIEEMAKNCKNIFKLVIRNCPEYKSEKFEEALGNLFSSNRNFRHLELHLIYKPRTHEVTADFLMKLPLDQMIRIYVFGLKGKHLENVLRRTKKLGTFNYCFCEESKSEIVLFKSICYRLNNLTKLELKNLSILQDFDADGMLSQIFKSNRQLKTIISDILIDLIGKCFIDLDQMVIEEIELSHALSIQASEVIKSWPYFKKLHKLHFESYSGGDFAHIAECIGLCSELKELIIFGIKESTSNELIKCLASSKHLESLNIFGQEVSNELFLYISENLLNLKMLNISRCKGISLKGIQLICKLENLEELHFSGCEEISDDSLELFNQLPKLQFLNIKGLSTVTGSGLTGFVNLKTLDCSHCENLEDNSVISLLRCSPKLELLDIRWCEKITNSVIDVAIEVTKSRRNNITLEIDIFGTSVDVDVVQKMSSMLHLDSELYIKRIENYD